MHSPSSSETKPLNDIDMSEFTIGWLFSMHVLLLLGILPDERRFLVQEGIFWVYISIYVIDYYRRGNCSYVLLELRQNIILHDIVKTYKPENKHVLNFQKMQTCFHENCISTSKTFWVSLPVRKSDIDGVSRSQKSVSFGMNWFSFGRNFDFKILK